MILFILNMENCIERLWKVMKIFSNGYKENLNRWRNEVMINFKKKIFVYEKKWNFSMLFGLVVSE